VAVIGRPHDEWGEEVVACVVARGSQPPHAKLARSWSAPRRVVPRPHRAVQAAEGVRVRSPSCRKNNTGKVLKTDSGKACVKL
jgi:acyl-CoA synthetase (AMP-forming)/AMP-acid ligase II